MTDRALSESAMLSSLRDITLPAEAPGGLLAEAAMVVALAACAALLVAGLLRLISLRRKTSAPRGLKADLAALQKLAEADRRVRLLHLLRAHAPDRYAALARRLYRPEGAVTAAELEAEMARLV
jgi:hypothetical protein